MINTEKLHNLIHSEGWKEFKKIIEAKKIDLSKKIIDKPRKNWETEILKIKTIEEMILIPENIVKKEILQKNELNSLWELPDSL